MLVRDDYLNAYREHEEFVSHYEDKMKRIIIKEAKASMFQHRIFKGTLSKLSIDCRVVQHHRRRGSRSGRQQANGLFR
jgi:hypothetical protein